MGEVSSDVTIRWQVTIPLRDGVQLNATLYFPTTGHVAGPVLVAMTPYVAQSLHETGMFFGQNGYAFLAVDVRGRGNSEGAFWPLLGEAEDGADIVDWVAHQDFCNGKIAMWGGSYAGYAQWATARLAASKLTTLVPVAAPYIGIDIPIRRNMTWPYMMQWLLLVAGRTSQDRLFFGNEEFWSYKNLSWHMSGRPYRELDDFLGLPSPVFQEWLTHPHLDDYWDSHNPSDTEYEQMRFPILSITGIYDADQAGTLAHYTRHLRSAPDSQHFLVIGPWDHAGTRKPVQCFAGVDFGVESLLDLKQLHLDWYSWTMGEGERPSFLRKRIAYFVPGLGRWRYADALDQIATRNRLFLKSSGTASGIFSSGSLTETRPGGNPDRYTFDPRDLYLGRMEAQWSSPLSTRPLFPVDDLRDQRMVVSNDGGHLVYHSEVFREPTEIAGFFELTVWLAIDQPDADFQACIYEVDPTGTATLLAMDTIRARYRRNPRIEELIRSTEPLQYDFDQFNFTAKYVREGSRLRLVIGPVNSIYCQRNYSTGKAVADEAASEGRVVTVTLYHDAEHPSALFVPVAVGGRE